MGQVIAHVSKILSLAAHVTMLNKLLHVCSDVKADHSTDGKYLSECVVFSQLNTQTQSAYRELHARKWRDRG